MPELPDFIAEPSFANPGTTPGMGQILPEAIQRTAAEVGQTADQFAQNALNLQR